MQKKDELRSIMLVGTGSDVGKSLICAGLGRLFYQDGYCPAPFKAQNMSLNSYPTLDGLEIGRAQAVQAEACKLSCRVEMNPILLKPTTDQKSQVILNGKVIGNQTAREYFLGKDRDKLFEEVSKSYTRLANEFNPVVLEGAGSISELNLKDKDIVNMRMALASDAAVYIVADIDRGGVFGSLYGTMELLDEKERAQIEGIIINKFRGDISLFDSGIETLERICKVPVVGVLPFFRDIYIEEEDSVGLKQFYYQDKGDLINIAVVLLDKMSNFTDFNVLERHPLVNLFYTDRSEDLDKAQIIILPGSKNTISDLQSLRKKKLDNEVINAAKSGKTVIGICGGYQMLGNHIYDPKCIEGNLKETKGLGLLPITTTISEEKICRQRTFCFRYDEQTHSANEAYEIHMGETTLKHDSYMNILDDGSYEGCFISPKIWGSYLHGILDNSCVIKSLLSPYSHCVTDDFVNYKEFKDKEYDRLASVIRKHLNMNLVYKALKKF
ncbi:MAG: cobyric acid synthase [Bacteroidales bacterium]